MATIPEKGTTLDALIAELLGDVGSLHREVKALDERLPVLIEQMESQLTSIVASLQQSIEHASDGAAGTIADNTAKLENATRQIMGHLQELVKTSGAIASAKMKEAREQQEMEMQRSVEATVNATIEKAVWGAISRLDGTLMTLEVTAARAEEKVAKAAEQARPGWSALIAGVTMLSALLGGAGGVLASRMF